MLRIRLRRVGKKKQPMYRIVVADSRAPRDGAFVENIGHYQPLVTPSTIVIDADRARHWLDKGAQPSDRVAKLLAVQGIAELPPKLKARIELGKQRAAEAAKAKPKAEAPEPAASAVTPAAPAEEAAPPAASTETPEAAPETPAEEEAAEEAEPASDEQPAGVEAPVAADQEPAEDAAAATEEEKTEG